MTNLERLRNQRNKAAMASILLLASAMAAAFPHMLFERRRLQIADDNLVTLQATIKYLEGEIRDTQRDIVTVQAELRSLNDESKR
jgi:septal ring factor EnvC (AmiA/AmiB activator)